MRNVQFFDQERLMPSTEPAIVVGLSAGEEAALELQEEEEEEEG